MEAVQTVDKAVTVLTAVIPISDTTSNAVKLYGCTGAIFQTPAAITGGTVIFMGSIDKGTTFAEIRDTAGNPITYTVAVNGSYPLDKNLFAGYDELKFIMASQAAERTILIKPFAI